MDNVERKLQELGISLPNVSKLGGSFIPAVQTGNLVYTAGQTAKRDGVLAYKGKLGKELTVEEGYEAAKLSMLNCLAVLKEHLGTLDKIKKVVKVLGFVASAPDFNQQPYVINGGSDLLIKILGEKGKHARSAIGASELPFNSPVEIEMIVEVE